MCFEQSHPSSFTNHNQIFTSFMWVSLRHIPLFAALSPHRFPSLSTLQIDDETWDRSVWRWKDAPIGRSDFREIGRYYYHLVPSFLASIQSGFLQNLVNLWVDQKVLCMPITSSLGLAGQHTDFYSVKDLWDRYTHASHEEQARKQEWVTILRAVFQKMESLRVGLGAMDDVEVGIILGCCSPSKLKQFGFHWNWQAYGRADVSMALLSA